MSRSYDVTIVGAGIVGLASAMKLVASNPGLKVAVLDKEARPGFHQTGHNSGVIHSGIYYKPGSLKARLCVSGAQQLVRFCQERSVPYEICGKIVIATRPEEIPRLHELHRRGTANGVPGLRVMNPAEIKPLEPHAHCLLGLHVPTTGIIDFGKVAETYAEVFQDHGGALYLGYRLTGLKRDTGGIRLETTMNPIFSKVLINCGGLYSDHIARMAGLDPPCQIVPFRGEYYEIKPERRYLVKSLIYPVPDPRFPFLGVHFTRMMNGKVEAGPNAVLALAREGYRKSTISLPEIAETLGYRGFWHMASRYWRPGMKEMVRSHSTIRFAQALQRLVPQIRTGDLVPGGSGVRAQALGRDGALLDDFVVLQAKQMVHVLNAPSPAATSSLAIADHIIGVVSPMLGWSTGKMPLS